MVAERVASPALPSFLVVLALFESEKHMTDPQPAEYIVERTKGCGCKWQLSKLTEMPSGRVHGSNSWHYVPFGRTFWLKKSALKELERYVN